MSTIDDLLAVAQAGVDAGAIPACQVAVAHRDEVVAFEAFGDATTDSRFAIFSATKPIVASAVWLLIGDGSVDVTAPVCEYVPELGARGMETVTVAQVMLHTSGFPNAPIGFVEGADADARRARFVQWRLEWEPGTRFEYHSTSAHWVLADLIERVAGVDFRDFIAERVCAPLGLPRIVGIPHHELADIVPLVAVGDPSPDDFAFEFNTPEARAAGVPGGGGFATTATVARFYQAVMHNPGELWDPAVLHDVTTNVRCTFDDPLMGAPVNRTLGLVLAGDDGLHVFRYALFGDANSPRAFGHAGAYGQAAWADPATGISFSFLHNAVTADQVKAGMRAHRVASVASALDL